MHSKVLVVRHAPKVLGCLTVLKSQQSPSSTAPLALTIPVLDDSSPRLELEEEGDTFTSTLPMKPVEDSTDGVQRGKWVERIELPGGHPCLREGTQKHLGNLGQGLGLLINSSKKRSQKILKYLSPQG